MPKSLEQDQNSVQNLCPCFFPFSPAPFVRGICWLAPCFAGSSEIHGRAGSLSRIYRRPSLYCLRPDASCQHYSAPLSMATRRQRQFVFVWTERGHFREYLAPGKGHYFGFGLMVTSNLSGQGRWGINYIIMHQSTNECPGDVLIFPR